MKICAKCGKENNDSATFCVECGQKFDQPAQPIQPVQQVQESNQNNQYGNQPPISYSQMMASNPVIKLIRQIGASPLFLAAVILFSVTVLLKLINIFIPAADVSPNINHTIGGINSFSAFVSSIGPVVICIGMWVQYAACKDVSTGHIKISGLSAIRVMNIINFVLYCILLALAFLGSLIILVSGSAIESTIEEYAGDAGARFNFAGIATGIIGIGLLIGVIIFGVFLILYYVKLLSTIKSIMTTASTGKPETKISMFVIVMNFILAVVSFVGLSISHSPVTVISSIVNAAFMIVISVALASYRSKIKMLDFQLKNSGNNIQFPQ
ncbi:MAG: zinc ribbon domain-containing protein [Oscillospiraceae bacterium]|nr:zinc ribbon domain-containing protein [Oscillospiraceae bacterium]